MIFDVLSVILTIIATILSVFNAILLSKQSWLSEKQTLIDRSKAYPLVSVEDVTVKGDVFQFHLKNKTHVPAYQLGCQIYFIPCSLEKKQLEWIDEIAWHDDKEAKKAYPRRVIIPLKNEKGKARLYDKEEGTFEAQALFRFSTSKKDLFSGKADSFADLKQRLTEQGIGFAAISIAFVYKNISETVIESEGVRNFTADFTKHATLEEAWNENLPFPFGMTLGYEDMPFFEYDVYMRYKGYRGRLEHE